VPANSLAVITYYLLLLNRADNGFSLDAVFRGERD
jgi:hypothetical protein